MVAEDYSLSAGLYASGVHPQHSKAERTGEWKYSGYKKKAKVGDQ